MQYETDLTRKHLILRSSKQQCAQLERLTARRRAAVLTQLAVHVDNAAHPRVRQKALREGASETLQPWQHNTHTHTHTHGEVRLLCVSTCATFSCVQGATFYSAKRCCIVYAKVLTVPWSQNMEDKSWCATFARANRIRQPYTSGAQIITVAPAPTHTTTAHLHTAEHACTHARTHTPRHTTVH